MREPAAPALPAVRSIAQLVCRVDMALGSSLSATVNLANSGKARVNRGPLVAESRGADQAWADDGSEMVTHCFRGLHPTATARRSS